MLSILSFSSVICISPPMLQSSELGEIAVMKMEKGLPRSTDYPNPSALIFFEI